MSAAYAFSSAVWSLVGGTVGYVLGRAGIDLRAIHKRRSMDGPDAVTAPARAQDGGWSVHWPTPQQWLGIVLVAIALASIASLVYQNTQLQRATRCYVQFTQDTSKALRARDADSQHSRAAAIDYAVANSDLWRNLLATARPVGQQETEDNREKSIAVLNKFFGASATYVSSLQALSKSAQTYPIPASHC